MEFHNKQFTPGIAWINGQPFQLGPGEATAAKTMQDHASRALRIQDPPVEDHSPAARARKAKRRLRRLFEHARRNAKGRARLCRSHEYEILRVAYQSVRAWRSEGVHEEIGRELRGEADRRQPSLEPVSPIDPLRPAAFGHQAREQMGAALDYADQQGIRSKRLSAFLHNNGGLEGAARARAKLGRETSERGVCHARSPNAV
jgi:hypothetical protein